MSHQDENSTWSPLDDLDNLSADIDNMTNSTINEETPYDEYRRVQKSKTDQIINFVACSLSYYFSLFGALFGVPYLYIKSVTLLTLYGFKYGYSWNNIKSLICQAELETNYFVSPMAQNDNNIFGMHCPSSRNSYFSGCRWNATEVSYVAQYDSIACSILDRFLWEKEWITLPITPDMDSQQYVESVYQNYNPSDPNYLTSWTSKIADSNFKKVCYTMVVSALPPLYLIIKK